jgi:hypothetical protein
LWFSKKDISNYFRAEWHLGLQRFTRQLRAKLCTWMKYVCMIKQQGIWKHTIYTLKYNNTYNHILYTSSLFSHLAILPNTGHTLSCFIHILKDFPSTLWKSDSLCTYMQLYSFQPLYVFLEVDKVSNCSWKPLRCSYISFEF